MSSNQSSYSNILRWFNPNNRSISGWAFILNRVTAIGLTIYLIMHLSVLSMLASGPDSYNAFVAFAKSPLIKIGEMFVIAGGIIHGLNGIRIALNGFGIWAKYQKQLFIYMMIIALITIGYFAFRMFTGA
jgi:succinate dehydrogenase / fumarate reductase, cytochrome b subunit